MKILLAYMILITGSIFINNPEFGNRTLQYYKRNPKIDGILNTYLTEQEARMAFAIVAPEICLFSKIENHLEWASMCISYINYDLGNFSIGLLQMKPSFAKQLEEYIKQDSILYDKYPEMLIYNTDARLVRKERLERLASVEWQFKYLALFIDVVKAKTKTLDFKSIDEKIAYWATLYNAGLNCSPEIVYKLQKEKSYPRFIHCYNYAEASVEFYNLYLETVLN